MSDYSLQESTTSEAHMDSHFFDFTRPPHLGHGCLWRWEFLNLKKANVAPTSNNRCMMWTSKWTRVHGDHLIVMTRYCISMFLLMMQLTCVGPHGTPMGNCAPMKWKKLVSTRGCINNDISLCPDYKAARLQGGAI